MCFTLPQCKIYCGLKLVLTGTFTNRKNTLLNWLTLKIQLSECDLPTDIKRVPTGATYGLFNFLCLLTRTSTHNLLFQVITEMN